VRFFNLANEFVDEWYGFHNPILGLADTDYLDPYEDCDSSDCSAFDKLGDETLRPYTMVLDLAEADFPHNEEEIRIKSVILAIQRSSEQDTLQPIDFQIKLVPNRGSTGEAELVRFAEDETVKSTTDIGRRRPYGRWIVQIVGYDLTEGMDISWLEDVLLIIEYEAKVHYN
jgi:hypothetical protein